MKGPLASSLLAVVTIISYKTFANYQERVIYGDDNRQEIYSLKDQNLKDLAKATLTLIPKKNISFDGLGHFEIAGETFGERYGMCSSERFVEQPGVGYCTGFLVAPDLVATAGHCIVRNDCQRNYFVTGYAMESEGQFQTLRSAADVYECQSIIQRKVTDREDFALIRLDRPVLQTQPLELSAEEVQVGQEIFTIGNPSGLPTKLTDKAQVKDLGWNFFRTNLDTYGGNSGSPVFNASTRQVIGVLVRGTFDYKWDDQNQCNRSNLVSEDVGFEDVTQISFIRDAMERAQ